MDKGNKLDFSGQHIYVGMDVHKKSWSVSIQTEQFEHKTFTQPPEVEKLTHYLQKTFPGATYHTVYEAGFSGFWLHDQLKEKGIDCMIVNPADDRSECRILSIIAWDNAHMRFRIDRLRLQESSAMVASSV